jgi:hypothetical protein
MDIEIGIVGKPKKWVLNQSRIRIGRDPKCEVNLPGKQFPTVSGEHLVLDVALGMVRVSSLSDSSSETYLNDRLASPGTVVRSGDVVRLGVGGPELNIRLLEPESEQSSSGYEPTRVINQEARDFSGPGATTVSPAPFPAVGSPRKHGYGTEPTPIPPASIRPGASIPSSGPRWADFGTGAGGVSTGQGSGRGPETTIMPGPERGPATTIIPGPIAPGLSRGPVTGLGAGTVSGTGTGADNVNSREIESKLTIVQVILAANVVLLLGLFVWLYQINRQLGQTRDEVREMHMQAQDAMKDLTPQLDARMGVFERRMDSMDIKMQAAEDHMVNRMNTEIPAMLDKYIDKKLAEKMGKP